METLSNMAATNNHRESWDSLSSAFSHLDASFSQDSCYGSDEVSVSSTTTAPLESSVSTFVAKNEKQPLHPILKSILKNSTADLQEEDDSDSESESESGYGSDDIELEYDALSEDEDDSDEDDMSDFSVWDEDSSHNVPETHEDHTHSFDDSFIGFEASVRFDPHIEYIGTPDTDLSEDEEASQSEMTVHEMMLLSLKSGSLQSSLHESDTEDDDSEDNCDSFFRANAPQLEDFTRDAVDVDQRLFVAYMNGIHGIADSNYKTYLRAQAANIRMGHETESMHPDDPPCMYLDSVLNHVIGVFRNLLAVDELNELIALRKEDSTFEPAKTTLTVEISAEIPAEASGPNTHQALLDKIEHFLLDRLTNGSVDVFPDELSFFAGGIAHALGTEDLPAII
ncbi:hypothetical protein N7540_009101 [Penicillium herquei]|nr:hypothetical protein N7540_009101 [Penicillium herquei]